jgi:hypothetical protein
MREERVPLRSKMLKALTSALILWGLAPIPAGAATWQGKNIDGIFYDALIGTDVPFDRVTVVFEGLDVEILYVGGLAYYHLWSENIVDPTRIWVWADLNNDGAPDDQAVIDITKH